MSNFTELQNKVLMVVEPWYEHTDEAHRMDHIRSVVSNVITIGTARGMPYRTIELGIIAAGYHDIFSSKEHRKVHHEMAHNWCIVNANILMGLYGVTRDEVSEIAHATLQHRGSFKGEYLGLVSELVAAADRGIPSPSSVDHYVTRSYLYGRTNLGLDRPNAVVHAVEHVKDKFGDKGYARVPGWYREMYSVELEAVQRRVAEFTPEHISQETQDKLEWQIQKRSGSN